MASTIRVINIQIPIKTNQITCHTIHVQLIFTVRYRNHTFLRCSPIIRKKKFVCRLLKFADVIVTLIVDAAPSVDFIVAAAVTHSFFSVTSSHFKLLQFKFWNCHSESQADVKYLTYRIKPLFFYSSKMFIVISWFFFFFTTSLLKLVLLFYCSHTRVSAVSKYCSNLKKN